jgi:type I restriction enzyme, S subunit
MNSEMIAVSKPKLRFKEFSDIWEPKKFNDILNITRLAGYEYSTYWQEDENKEIIALRGYNIGKGGLELRNLGYISNRLSMQLIRSRLSKGDIVYPCVGTIGNAVVIEENDKFHIQQNIAKLTPKENISPYFIAQFLMSDRGMREVNKFNATSSQPNILVGSLRNFQIYLPSPQEQIKVANFLKAIDEKIAQLIQKNDLLTAYKKGVMEQIFSQKLQFKDKDNQDFPEWEEVQLGMVFKDFKGFGLSKDKIGKIGKNKCILYGHLFTKYSEVITKVDSFTDFDEGLISEIGDILMPSSTTTNGIDLAKASSINEANILLGGDIIVLRLKKKGNSDFFAYLLTHAKSKENICDHTRRYYYSLIL